MFDWTPLHEEFAIWRGSGLTLPLWWRDDDAVAPGAALDQLGALAQDLDIPVHLAVIPQRVHEALGQCVRHHSHLQAVTHGWAHVNSALPRKKSCEFGRHRDAACVRTELVQGYRIMSDLFAQSFTPVFAPPWNRFHYGFAPLLGEVGYGALSLFKPRIWQWAAPGVTLINTHVDPIDWRGTRTLASPDGLIAKTVKLMQDRRMGYTDPREPLGFMTHHLDHDAAIWDFCHAYLEVMRHGPVRITAPLEPISHPAYQTLNLRKDMP